MVKKLVMALVLMPMMALATTWYVNGSMGSDLNSGTSESVPKATIQAAIDASSAGDTILVAPGTYAPIASASKVLSIRSTQGALVTIIDGHVGGGTKRCVHLADASGSFGPPEESSGAYDSLFEGFTIRNGRAEDDYGGGIRGGTVRNCIIEFCASSGAGGAYGCKLYQCIVRNNIAGDDGGGLHSCIAYDTLIVGNEAHNSWGGCAGAAASCSKLYNCTITKNISTGSSVAALDYYISAYNCIVWGNTKTGGESADVLYASTYNCYTADPGFVDAANGDYRLAAGSPCIDAGDNSYVTTTTDLVGNARIANGTVDIGCYEYGSSGGDSLADGLVAYYPFDGNANDASGSGNNGVVHGATLTADRFGNANGAYYFGNGNYITVPGSYSLNSISEAITISAWVKIDDWYITGNPWAPIVSKGTAGWAEYSLNLTTTRNETIVGDSSIVADFAVTPALGEWGHVAVTYGADHICYAYVNGVCVGTKASTTTAFSTSATTDLARLSKKLVALKNF